MAASQSPAVPSLQQALPELDELLAPLQHQASYAAVQAAVQWTFEVCRDNLALAQLSAHLVAYVPQHASNVGVLYYISDVLHQWIALGWEAPTELLNALPNILKVLEQTAPAAALSRLTAIKRLWEDDGWIEAPVTAAGRATSQTSQRISRDGKAASPPPMTPYNPPEDAPYDQLPAALMINLIQEEDHYREPINTSRLAFSALPADTKELTEALERVINTCAPGLLPRHAICTQSFFEANSEKRNIEGWRAGALDRHFKPTRVVCPIGTSPSKRSSSAHESWRCGRREKVAKHLGQRRKAKSAV
ncbi:uncharacterized protein MONBRDRAFT_23260 [Monosiga brevicollis MX1]|uniref:CID domain-containing protein n=1 Tax=Monosiga brevicollis TaxID=81824 RepID=A9USV8_MONBE|nr:uncharacterized protein MONBRDRAFT_23260 [Monosiga brevicollis MX1]EDQ91133.1 predicted protein [Monosiga brevicollis MX1]|eukprot:XP_001743555.1 hypothetical protein [Monosiga brevicollis MX1]